MGFYISIYNSNHNNDINNDNDNNDNSSSSNINNSNNNNYYNNSHIKINQEYLNIIDIVNTIVGVPFGIFSCFSSFL